MTRWMIGWLLLVASSVSAAELSTAVATYEQLPLERWFDGTIEAVNGSTVSAETKGRVAEIFFDIGDTVPAGSVILKLVSNEQREVLNQAEAKVSEAKANLESDTKEYERLNTLFKKNVISKTDWDKVTARYNISKAQLASAESSLKTAREQLSYTEIRAPYGGLVSARHVELGEAVFPGKALMSGFAPKPMRVHVDLPQAVAEKVRDLHKARVVRNGTQEIASEKIIIYPVADPATSTVRTRIELSTTAPELYPGEFVKVGFTVGDIKRLLIPTSSILYRSEVTGVYVVKNNIPRLRQVRLGNHFGNKTEVLAGLAAGESVAIDPIAAGIALQHLKSEKSHE